MDECQPLSGGLPSRGQGRRRPARGLHSHNRSTEGATEEEEEEEEEQEEEEEEEEEEEAEQEGNSM